MDVYNSAISEGFHQINYIKKIFDQTNKETTLCCKIETRFELNTKQKKHRSTIVYTFTDSSNSTSSRYYYSPEKNKVWYFGTLDETQNVLTHFNDKDTIPDMLLHKMLVENIDDALACAENSYGKSLLTFTLKMKNGKTIFCNINISPISD